MIQENIQEHLLLVFSERQANQLYRLLVADNYMVWNQLLYLQSHVDQTQSLCDLKKDLLEGWVPGIHIIRSAIEKYYRVTFAKHFVRNINISYMDFFTVIFCMFADESVTLRSN